VTTLVRIHNFWARANPYSDWDVRWFSRILELLYNLCVISKPIYILDDPNWRIFFRNDGLPRICVNHWSTIIVWYQIQLQVKDNGYSLEPKESGRSTHCMDIMDMAQDESPKKTRWNMLTFPHFQTRMLKCEKASQETDETSKKWMVDIPNISKARWWNLQR
jgi:hypothetical protein